MRLYIIKRLGQGVIAVFLLMLIIFVLARLTGDPTYLMVDEYFATPEMIENIRASYGLDKSYPEQFFIFVRGVVTQGDFGNSMHVGRPALEMFLDRLPNSFMLVIPAVLLAFALGDINTLANGSDDLGNGNVVGPAGEPVAATRPAQPLDETVSLQPGKQLLQVGQRYALAFGDPCQCHRTLTVVNGQIEHGRYGVAAFS